MQVRITPEAKEAIKRVCRREGITQTALIEVIGRALGSGQLKITKGMIDEARAIDDERHA